MRAPASNDSRSGLGLGVLASRGLGAGVLDAVGALLELLRREGAPPDLVGGDLLEPDAQRLASGRGDLRRHHVAEALAELVEVGVDVARPAGGEGDKPELGVDPPEELLDRRGHHRVVLAFHLVSGAVDGEGPRTRRACSTGREMLSAAHPVQVVPLRAVSMIASISLIVSSRSSLTTTWSASARPIGSSSSALRSRART